MKKFVIKIDWVLSRFLIFLMAMMVLTVTWQVITRFIIQSPSSYTEELARFLLIWIGILGAAFAVRTRAHLGIDIILQKVEGKHRIFVIETVLTLVVLFAFFIMVIGGMHLVNLTFTLNQVSAAMGMRMGYIYIVIPLSGLIIILYSVYYMWAFYKGDEQQFTIEPERKGVE